MAEIFTQEGLDWILGKSFGITAGSVITYLGLFVSATPTTVPASDASGGSLPYNWTEMTASTGTYGRIAMAASLWGAAASIASGRKFSHAQQTFTGFTSSSPANGFFISTGSVPSQATGKCICFANFDAGASRALVTVSDQLLITPTVGMLY
jgi:hypothetical protein